MDAIDEQQKNTFVTQARNDATSRAQPAKTGGVFDKIIGLMDKANDVAVEAFEKYGTEKGRRASSLKERMQKAIVEFVNSEGDKLVEDVPFANVIVITIKLSIAFAGGVGEALDEVNSKLMKKYDLTEVLSHPEDLTDKDIETLKSCTRYLANDLRELNGILTRGLTRAAEEGVKMLLEAAGEKIKDMVKDLATEIAKSLIETNEVISIFAGATREAVENIPEWRRKAFYYVANAFLESWSDQKFAGTLKNSIKAIKNSDESIDVAILASIIKILIDGGYEIYRQEALGPEEVRKLQQTLMEMAHDLAEGIGLPGFHLEESETLEVKSDHIGLPKHLKINIETRGEGSVEEDLHYLSHLAFFIQYVNGLQTSLDLRGRRYQKFIDYVWSTTHDDTQIYNTQTFYEKQAERDYQNAEQKSRRARQNMIKEFGHSFFGIVTHNVDSDTDYKVIRSSTSLPLLHVAQLRDPRRPPD